MIVVDASAVIEVLLNTDSGRRALPRLMDENESLHTPHLLDVEVTHVVRRLERSGSLTAGRGLEALGILRDLALTRYPHDILVPRMWELQHNLTAYDAAYIALAEALDAPLLTCDAALASVSGHRARVELI